MKYEYKVISLRGEIQKIRDSKLKDEKNPVAVYRPEDGDEVLIIEILNQYGKQGWRAMNPDNGLEVYLERVVERG